MPKSHIVALSLLATSALAFATPAQAQRVERIVAFRDSYADDGNFFALAGIDPLTTGPYTSGRFSGGTNYVDTLGEILDVPIENFAIGGARTGIGNQSNPFSWGFTYEVDQFLDVGAQSGVFPTIEPQFQPGDLVTVSIGGNDSRAYQLGGGSVAGAAAAADVSIMQASANLDRLVDAGAPTISFLAGDTGLLPEVNFQPDPALAASVRSAFSTAFNSGMQSTLAGYAADGVIVHYLDLGLVLQSIEANPEAFGINEFACPAFPAPLGPGVPGSTACIVNSAGFLVYGDQLHLTSNGFKIVGQYVAAQLTAPLVLQAPSDLGLDVARQFGRTLTARMDTGSPRDGDAYNGLKFFLVGDGFTSQHEDGPTNLAFRSSGVGATAGVEYGFGTGVVGAAVNYSRARANFTSDAADVDGHSLQLGGYGAFAIGPAFVQAYAGYGWDDHDVERTGVVDGMEADTDGNHFLAGIKGGYLMPLGAVRVGPVVGLDYAKAKVDGYTESGDPALTLNVDSLSYRSLRGSLGVELRSDLDGGGVQLRPYASAVVEKDFTGDDRTVRFAQTSAPTIVNSFELEDASKKAYGRFTGGFSAAIFSTVSLEVSGSATIGKDHGNETSANVGVRIGL